MNYKADELGIKILTDFKNFIPIYDKSKSILENSDDQY